MSKVSIIHWIAEEIKRSNVTKLFKYLKMRCFGS